MNNKIMLDFGFFTLKDQEWLDKQRIAGKYLKEALNIAYNETKEGVSTKYINDIVETYLNDINIGTPFKGHEDFPAACCISVNEELAHGIPRDDVIIKEKDVVKIDIGTSFEGAIADAAFTKIIGENKEIELLSKTCENSLNKIIDLLNKKEINFIGDIGYVIKKEANNIRANPIEELTGHGLDYNVLHAQPFIYNSGKKNEGIKIIPNMTICIEPMITFGNSKIFWNKNGGISLEKIGVHFEKTLFIHKDCVEVIA